MSPRHKLILASAAFAFLWAAAMGWWNSPLPSAGLAILAVMGAIEGLVWFWAMRACLTWAGLLTGPRPQAAANADAS